MYTVLSSYVQYNVLNISQKAYFVQNNFKKIIKKYFS